METWTLLKWCLLAVGAMGALYGLHRLALRLEERGYIYYLHKKSGGSAVGSFVALQRVLEPTAEHVQIVREERTRRAEQGSGAPPLASGLNGDDEESLRETPGRQA
jgi:hypothetical protein